MSNKSYARVLMISVGGIMEIIGLALEFPSILYLLRDGCITACKVLERIPSMLGEGALTHGDSSAVLFTNTYYTSLMRLGFYFSLGVGLSKIGSFIQRESTISWIEKMYVWS